MACSFSIFYFNIHRLTQPPKSLTCRPTTHGLVGLQLESFFWLATCNFLCRRPTALWLLICFSRSLLARNSLLVGLLSSYTISKLVKTCPLVLMQRLEILWYNHNSTNYFICSVLVIQTAERGKCRFYDVFIIIISNQISLFFGVFRTSFVKYLTWSFMRK